MTDSLEQLRAALADRYTVQRPIGQGGMATVYLARDDRHERLVAIKVLRPELAASLGGDRFLREIRVAARLQHPHILPLYDSGEAGGLLYYVMPFVQGESLRQWLDREQQLPLAEAVRVACEVADALYYAHGQGVIHRDIKPENVLLEAGHALVADFGIAKALSAAGADKLTETGMAVGTPHYMSPEQAHGTEHLDGRTDQYSLACVLYEMLVGQPPFSGPNAMAILARHSMESVPSLQVVRHSVPDAVEDAIMRALEKTPADRFHDIKEFSGTLAAADLGPTARRTPAHTAVSRRTSPRGARAVRPVPGGGRGGRWGRGRWRWPVSLAALVAVTAAAWGVWQFWLSPSRASGGETGGLDPNRIAVLYFDKAPGGSDSLGYLADGLTEALIHELSGVSGLQVISSNGVRAFRNASASPQSIARQLQVGTLVQGGITQSAGRLRVTVSLVNANSGSEIGSTRVERPRDELFALQDDLAKEVSDFLRQRLGQEIKLQATRIGTRNAAAWELLQRAQAEARGAEPLVAAGDSAAAGRQFGRADSLLASAEALDPRWAMPATQRGWVAYRRSRSAGSFDKAYYDSWTTKGLGHAERALQLKPNDPDALELRGTLRYWRWLLNLAPDSARATQLVAAAERDLRASVAANPAQASAWTSLSHLLITQVQTAEGKLAALRAYEADPYMTTANLTLWRLFLSSVDLEDPVEASHWCAEGRRRFPADLRFVECQIRLMALPGQSPDVGQAWRLLDEYIQLTPPHQREYRQRYGQMLIAIALARAGLVDSARAVAVHARADARVDPTRELIYNEVLLRAILGDRDEALRLLGVFLATNPQMRASVARDQSWWFRDLRRDPRFRALAGPAD